MNDPIEQMESRQDRAIESWEAAQRGVPHGSCKCPFCGNVFDYEPIQLSPDPHSEAGCYECLPDDSKKAYDEFFGKQKGT